MKTYSLPRQWFTTRRSQAARGLLVTLAIVGVVGWWMLAKVTPGARAVVWLLGALFAGLAGHSTFRTIRQHKALWERFELTLGADHIAVRCGCADCRRASKPPVHIQRDEIVAIWEMGHGLAVTTADTSRGLTVPAELDARDFQEIRATLSTWCPIQAGPPPADQQPPQEAEPPPEPVPIRSYCHSLRCVLRAAVSGLLFPMRLYLQPRSVLGDAVGMDPGAGPVPPPVLTYLFALVWVPLSIMAELLVLGDRIDQAMDEPRLSTVLALAAGGFLVIGIGSIVGGGIWTRRFRRSYRLSGSIFDYNMAAAFSVVLALTFFSSHTVLGIIAARNDLTIGHVVECAELNLPASFVAAVWLGAGASMVWGYRSGAGTVVKLGLPAGLGLVALLAAVSGPDGRAGNALFAASLTLLLTHLAFQPVYLVLGLASGLVARIRPAWSRLLWRLSPANWAEYSYVPLPGLPGLVMALHGTDPEAGRSAIDKLKDHPFYGRVGRRLSERVQPAGTIDDSLQGRGS